jgi:serine/threonine protein kinase
MFRSSQPDDWQPVLIDFGAAKNSVDEGVEESVTVSEFYTPLYSPPNHHQRTPVERDLFAAAAVLSVVAMKKQPTTRNQLLEFFGDLNESEFLSGYFYRVLERALIPTSTNFFNSVNQFVDELEKARTSEIEAKFADRKSVINFVVKLSAREAVGRYLTESSESAMDLLRTSGSGAFWISFAETGLREGSPLDFHLLFDGFEAVCAVNNAGGASAPFVIKTVRKLKDVQFERVIYGLDELSIYLKPNFHETEKSANSHTEQTLKIFDDLFHRQKRLLQKALNQKEPGDFVRKAKSVIEARKTLLLDGVPELDFELVDSDATFATVRVDTSFEIPDSSAWQLQDSKLRNVFFTLSGSSEENLFLKSSRPVDQWPSKGRLIPHLGLNETAFKRQLDALEEIENGRMIFPNLTGILENPESVREFSIAQSPSIPALDDSKNHALLSALSSKDVFLLEGPPGTGKTSYITALLQSYLDRNPADRVLLVSQTNVAIDNVLERLPENLVSSTVRVSREDSSIVSKGAEGFVIDNRLRIWREQVAEESQQYFGQSEIAPTETVVQAEKLAALQKLRHLLLEAERFQSQMNQRMTTLSAAVMDVDLDELPDNLGIAEKVKSIRQVLS